MPEPLYKIPLGIDPERHVRHTVARAAVHKDSPDWRSETGGKPQRRALAAWRSPTPEFRNGTGLLTSSRIVRLTMNHTSSVSPSPP